ncbi:hypothetical protein PRIPAC_87551 [Pristionchus pacificus]|uniref:Uncharacterized protein n=1 Tax=Pristionchus pacificus TaxID=54126 RepID=A0A2A6CW22_PRIPA|nr:hypothetical protein PRIPAC_87551 [Pristionchus pacificus]|eukprot:PDM82211.1 hypothetical protein PRIPAC_36604 [Pristionchus pacificus]
MTDPGSASELLHLFEDYEFEEPQASWRKNKYEKENNEVHEPIDKDENSSQQFAPIQASVMLAYWREIDRKREVTNELVNVLIDENERISREIVRIQKSEEMKFFEFLKQSKKRNEEDEKENDKLIRENATVYSQLKEAMERKKEVSVSNTNIVRESNISSYEQLEMLKNENEQLTKAIMVHSKGELGKKIAEILAENEKMIADINLRMSSC